jgi:hypothetical protein
MEAGVLEALFRGIAIGALAAVALGLWRGRDGPARVGGALFCLGVAAYVLNSSPALIQSLGWFAYPVHFVALGGQGLFWLFIVTLFEDRAVSPLTLAPWALLTAVGLLGQITPPPWVDAVWIAHNLIEAGFSIHALFVIARSWRGDLVEARRRLRGPFLATVTLFVLVPALRSARASASIPGGMASPPGQRSRSSALRALQCSCSRGRNCSAQRRPRRASHPRPSASPWPSAPLWRSLTR